MNTAVRGAGGSTGKRGSWGSGLGTAAPVGDTHVLSSMGPELLSALWFCLGRNTGIGHSVFSKNHPQAPSSFQPLSISLKLKGSLVWGSPIPVLRKGTWLTEPSYLEKEDKGPQEVQSSGKEEGGEHRAAKGEEAQT